MYSIPCYITVWIDWIGEYKAQIVLRMCVSLVKEPEEILVGIFK